VPEGSQGSAQSSNLSVQQQISSSTEQLPTSEQLSRNSSLHSSFRSSPVPTGTVYNLCANQNSFSESSLVSAPPQLALSSRPIPTRVLEPATPQNTPCNVSFPGFVPFVNRDLPASSLDKEIAAFKSSNQPHSLSEFSKGGIVELTAESASKPPLISGETNTTFTPISAAKITEKLEHLLAEQQEGSLCEAVPEASSKADEIASGVALTELTKSFEPQTPQTTNESIDKSCEIKSSDAQEKTAEPKSNTWSDVFLGQEPTTQSLICPEVHTADNNSIVTDIQAIKPNAHPPQQPQLYQAQPISMPSSTFCTNKSVDQKSSLNYVSPFSQQSSFSGNSPKLSEQSAGVFLESAKPNQFINFQSQESKVNAPFNQPTTGTASNPQQLQDNFAFDSVGINSTSHASLWSTDQSSQSQILNTAANQPIYTASSQTTAPVFYNPAQFASEPPKQSVFPHTYDQHSAQQQSYQGPLFYGNTHSRLQQPYVTESNTAYASPVVSMVTAVPEPTGSATLSPVQMSVNSPTNRSTPDTVPPSFQNWVRSFRMVLYS